MRNMKKSVLLTAVLIIMGIVLFAADVFAYTTDAILENGFSELINLESLEEESLAPKGTGSKENPRVVYTTKDFLEAMEEGSYTYVTLSDGGKTSGTDKYIFHDLGNKLVTYGASPEVKILKIEGKHKFYRNSQVLVPFMTVGSDDLIVEGDENSALIYECTADVGLEHYMFEVVDGNILTFRGAISLLTMQDEFKNASGAYASSVAVIRDGELSVGDEAVLYGAASSDGYRSSAVILGQKGGEFEKSPAYAFIDGGRFVCMRYDEETSAWKRDDITNASIYVNEKEDDLVAMSVVSGIFNTDIKNSDGTKDIDDYILMGHDVHRYGEKMIAVTQDCMGLMNMYPEYDPSKEKTEVYAYEDELLEFLFDAVMSDVTERGFTRDISVAVHAPGEMMSIEEKIYPHNVQGNQMSFIFDGTDRQKYEIGETYEVVINVSLTDPYGNYVTSEKYKYSLHLRPKQQITLIEFSLPNYPIIGSSASQPPSFAIMSDDPGFTVSEMGWIDSDKPEDVFTGTFEKDKTYRAYVILNAKDGNVFAKSEDMTVLVGKDEAVDVSVTAYGQVCYIVLTEFDSRQAKPDKIIDTITIEELYPPVGGKSGGLGVDSIITSGIDDYIVGESIWRDVNGHEFMGNFITGEKYIASHVFIAKDYAEFADEDEINVTINGLKAENVVVYDTKAGNNAVCEVTVTLTAIENTVVNEIIIEDPVVPHTGDSAANEPQFAIVSDTAGYEIEKCAWIDENDQIYTGTFEKSKTYRAYALITCSHGAEFAPESDLKITVDGKDAEYERLPDGKKCLVKVMEFTAAEKPADLTITNKIAVKDIIIPKAGDDANVTPMFEMYHPMTGFSCYSAYWTDEFGGLFLGTFEEGKTYEAHVVLKVLDGYVFDEYEKMNVTVKGQPTQFAMNSERTQCNVMVMKFTIPKEEYLITFDTNGGTGTMADVKVKYGVEYSLPECTFTAPEGKEFKTWRWDVGGKEYAAGDKLTVSDQSITEVSLKAVWKDKASQETYLLGDVNKDGKINALDATQILRYANNKASVIASMSEEEAKGRADVNKDGKINALDATQILRYANNKASVLK